MTTPLPLNQILCGDCCEVMNRLPPECAHLVFADPPYNLQLGGELWRPDQTHVDAVRDDWDRFGSLAEYDRFTREWLTAARRVLRPDGTLWVMGSYHNIYRVGAILQDLGFWILNDVAWVKCLAESTRVYARTSQGEQPIALRDLIRSQPEWVQLWNGCAWTSVQGWTQTEAMNGLEIHLRSGEKVRCTPTHQWPVEGVEDSSAHRLVMARDLREGDTLVCAPLPEPENNCIASGLDDAQTGWFVGLYIAEGSRYDGTITFAGHLKERARFQRLRRIAEAFHGQCTWHETRGNSAQINMHGPMLNALLDAYVGGRTAKTKFLSTRCWQRSNTFLRALLEGYLEGDGHYDAVNDRWRLGFAQNQELEASLRTLAARLDIQLQLKDARGKYNHQDYSLLRGEVCWVRPTSVYAKKDMEIVSIRSARTTRFIDIAVKDDPHLFALASGVLTHNSNPMPNMKGTRFCNAHETLIWAKKSAEQKRYTFHYKELKAGNDDKQMRSDWYLPLCTGRERETVNGKKAHATQKPESLLHRVLASTTNPGDVVLDPFCGTGTTAAVAKRLGRSYITIDRVEAYVGIAEKRLAGVTPAMLDGGGVLIDAPRPRVPFVALVESGRLPVGSILRLKGTQVRGVVHLDGTVSAEGMRGSIHKMGCLLLKLPSCNGWLTWLYTDPLTGEERPIDALRDAAFGPTS